MLTFSMNRVTALDEYSVRVWSTIQDNLGYFRTFEPIHWQEAVVRTYMLALDHYNPNYTDVTPYIKKLARTVLRDNTKDRPYTVYNDDGEISNVFRTLTENIGSTSSEKLEGTREIKESLKELYLFDPDAFMKLQNIFVYDEIAQFDKADRIKSPYLRTELSNILGKYGSELTFKVMYDFFAELPDLVAVRTRSETKEINLRKPNPSILDKIPDAATIVDSKSKRHYIDKSSLTMESNPDYFKWDVIGSTNSEILRIDISEIANYMYEQVFVDKQISTKHIQWCDSKYRLLTPAGIPMIGLDRDKFMTVVRVELIMNILMNNVGSLVAVSPDYMYIKPARSFVYDRLRIRFANNKVFDLPVDVYIRKRRESSARTPAPVGLSSQVG